MYCAACSNMTDTSTRATCVACTLKYGTGNQCARCTVLSSPSMAVDLQVRHT
jgi:hypothetical protein